MAAREPAGAEPQSDDGRKKTQRSRVAAHAAPRHWRLTFPLGSAQQLMWLEPEALIWFGSAKRLQTDSADVTCQLVWFNLRSISSPWAAAASLKPSLFRYWWRILNRSESGSCLHGSRNEFKIECLLLKLLQSFSQKYNLMNQSAN